MKWICRRARPLVLFLAALLLIAPVGGETVLADTIILPAPVTEGGLGLFSALKKRSSVSGGDFSVAEVSLEELSTILWAASGLNRGQTGWTVPMAEGLEPYVKIYVAGPNGVWLYRWADHSLEKISTENIKPQMADQAFVRKAYYVLILTSDHETSSKLQYVTPEVGDDFTQILVGAMTQDIYLAAAALNLGTRYIHSLKSDFLKTALALPAEDYPIALMMIGK